MIGPIHDPVQVGLNGRAYAALLWRWESYALRLRCCICSVAELRGMKETSRRRRMIVSDIKKVRLR